MSSGLGRSAEPRGGCPDRACLASKGLDLLDGPLVRSPRLLPALYFTSARRGWSSSRSDSSSSIAQAKTWRIALTRPLPASGRPALRSPQHLDRLRRHLVEEDVGEEQIAADLRRLGEAGFDDAAPHPARALIEREEVGGVDVLRAHPPLVCGSSAPGRFFCGGAGGSTNLPAASTSASKARVPCVARRAYLRAGSLPIARQGLAVSRPCAE